MATTFNPEYSKMLNMPVLLEGPRKDAIDSLQKQIDFYVGETSRLRYAQNSHVLISRLPAELLSDVFLYVVETGLKDDYTSFALGTFGFLQVCRRWNEVAVGFPQLWVWWIPGAVKAWHLFKSRSNDAPLFLTWKHHLPDSARDILTSTGTPKRFRQFYFDGGGEELEHLLAALNSCSLSITSSIRLHDLSPNNDGEHLTRFFSLAFPKLSKLDLKNYLPDSSSSILITSNLTSLKLSLRDDFGPRRYTLSQLSRVLQQHPDLQELELQEGALPPVEKSGAPAPVVLPRLINLSLYGSSTSITAFMDLVNMSSPLHNVIVCFRPISGPIKAFVSTAKKLLMSYYGCEGLEHPRRVNCLTISLDSSADELIVDARSRSTTASHPIYHLRLQFHQSGYGLAQKIIPLVPLKRVREFTAERLFLLFADDWRKALRRMKGLIHLRLDSTDIEPVLDALGLDTGANPDQPIIPKLKSLSFQNISLFYSLHQKLLEVLEERRHHDVGLKGLVLRSCRVPSDRCKADLKGLVKKVTWDNMMEMGSDYEVTGTEEETEETDSDGFYDYWDPRRHYRF